MTSSQPQRWIAHVDLDAFFASCEQRDNPEYRGLPVMVGALPGGRGVVAAASYEARRYGVRSAMPVSEAYRRCPDGVFLRPDFAKYSEASRNVFAILRDIAPAVEKASVDEAYLDLSGLERLFGPPAVIGTEIKRRIFDSTRLTASVGIGPNRLIAKLGSAYRKPDGLTVVQPRDVQAFLDPLPVSNLRGNGRQTQKIFARLGIETIAQVRAADPAWLAHHLGRRAAESFIRQSQGLASDHIETARGRKSIARETTFGRDQTSRALLREKLQELSRSVAATARRENLAGRVIKLKVRYEDFATLTRQKSLDAPTQSERVLLDTAWQLFCRPDLPVRPVRLIGVGLSDWGERVTAGAQADLFAAPAAPTDDNLLRTIDAVADRFGAGKLSLGAPRGRRDESD